MASLEQLINHEDPALPLLSAWCANPGGNGGILLPSDDAIRINTLQRLQITTRSILGTIVYETGVVFIAKGLIRLLGSGTGRSLQETHEQLGCPLDGSYPDVLMVADDMFGGLFALNGGRFGQEGGVKFFIWRPTTLSGCRLMLVTPTSFRGALLAT